MRRATFLASARDDLLSILSYIASQSGSVTVGRTFVQDLRAKCHKLAALETIVGRPRPELDATVRSFPYRGYLIFFRYVTGRFEVVNILEGHRDVEAHFRDDRES